MIDRTGPSTATALGGVGGLAGGSGSGGPGPGVCGASVTSAGPGWAGGPGKGEGGEQAADLVDGQQDLFMIIGF